MTISYSPGTAIVLSQRQLWKKQYSRACCTSPIPSSVHAFALSESIEAFVKETSKPSHCEIKLQLISEINKPVYRRQHADLAVPGVARFPRWNTSLDVKSLRSAQTCRRNRRKKCNVGIELINSEFLCIQMCGRVLFPHFICDLYKSVFKPLLSHIHISTEGLLWAHSRLSVLLQYQKLSVVA